MAEKEPIGELVKSPEWQKVRKSLLGNWSEKPEWCCKQLRDYLGNISSTTNDKIRIVMNYLTGTGFRLNKITHPCISKLRSQLSSEIKKRKSQKEWV